MSEPTKLAEEEKPETTYREYKISKTYVGYDTGKRTVNISHASPYGDIIYKELTGITADKVREEFLNSVDDDVKKSYENGEEVMYRFAITGRTVVNQNKYFIPQQIQEDFGYEHLRDGDAKSMSMEFFAMAINIDKRNVDPRMKAISLTALWNSKNAAINGIVQVNIRKEKENKNDLSSK